jgi:hypothetical protein
LRIPLPIDDRKPERGLLGMLENFRDLIFAIDTWYCRCGRAVASVGDTPTEAILKALVAQEGL